MGGGRAGVSEGLVTMSRSRCLFGLVSLAITSTSLAVVANPPSAVAVVSAGVKTSGTATAAKLAPGDLDERPARPDSVSAMVTARASDTTVEDV